MRWLCWSFWLVGICLASAARGAPGAETESQEPRAVERWTTELANGIRLGLAKSGPTARDAFCLTVAPATFGNDPKPEAQSLGVLVSLQMRADSLVNGLRERTERAAHDWQTFERVQGDRGSLCVLAPSSEHANALSALLDVLKPTAISTADCLDALAQWRERRGLARVAELSGLAERVHALAWLGSRDSVTSFATLVQEPLGPEICQGRTSPYQFSVTLTAAGDLDSGSFEAIVRAHPVVRRHQKPAPAVHKSNDALPRLPAQTYPRFLHLRSTVRDDSSVLMAWPLVGQSEREHTEMRLLAALVQHRLNQRFGSASGHRATARTYWENGRGTLQIEVRPIRADDLTATEEHIFSVIEQLRSTPVSAADISAARTLAARAPQLTGDWLLDEALDVRVETVPSWRRRDTKNPLEISSTPAELRHWAGQVLSRLEVSEIFCEAITPPRAATHGHNEGQRPKGLVYVVKPGESLQMIAHRFHVTIPDLIRTNRLPRPDQIAPGTRLTVPTASSTTPSK